MMPFLFVLILIVLGTTFQLWLNARARKMIEAWAADNGFRILEMEYRPLRRGPYAWNTPAGRMVFRVLVQDGDGRKRPGWLRCGHWLMGMGLRHVDISWE